MADTERNPWDPDHELSEEAVRRAIEHVRPTLKPVRLERLGEGWDFWAYLANERWVFRFPKRREEQERLRREYALLPALEPYLGLDVPHYEGSPLRAPEVPYGFGVYERLEGIQANQRPFDSVDGWSIGLRLGQELRALHAIPRGVVQATGARIDVRKRDAEEVRARSRDLLRWIPADDPDLRAHAASWCSEERPLPPPYEGPDVLAHTDPHSEHLLLTAEAPHQARGLIDWGDLSYADPALDLSGLYPWGGEAVLAALLEGYAGNDEHLEARARFVGIGLVFLELDYACQRGRTDLVPPLLDVLRKAPLS